MSLLPSAEDKAYALGYQDGIAHAKSALAKDGAQEAVAIDFEADLFSDEMDSAVNAFVCTRHGILKNAERSGEETDGEKVMRRSLASAMQAYFSERPLYTHPSPLGAVTDEEVQRAKAAYDHEGLKHGAPGCHNALLRAALAQFIAGRAGGGET